ncbi:MAG: sugar phosphate isomerase/epimerase family protein [Halosimplex sp.]
MQTGLTVGDSIERLQDTAGGVDVDFVELSIGESGYAPGSRDDDLRDALAAVGADLHVHLPFDQVVATPVAQFNEAVVDYLRELLAWAGTVGAEKAVLHGTTRDPHDTDQRAVFADQLRSIDAAGAEAGVEVVVENVGHQRRGLQLSVLGDLARETGTAVCFDVGHAYAEDGHEGIERSLAEYGDLVSHLHVHDVRSRGDTHLPLGAGEIDYARVADLLPEFDGTVAAEVFTDDVPLLSDTIDRIETHLDG